MVPTMARTMLYRNPLAHTRTVIKSPSRPARHQYTVRTVVRVSVPTLRTAAKSWVPSKGRRRPLHKAKIQRGGVEAHPLVQKRIRDASV